jgi:membrane protease YdiL (CAAX protease family)
MIRQVYSDRVQWKIGVFLLLTFVISSFFYYIIISSSTVFDIGGFWMWSPGIAAILTKMLFRENLRDFGLKIEKPKYLVLGLSIPFLYALLIHSLVWVTGVGEFTPQPALKIFLFSTLGLVIACFFALGEEIGWRGLLIPELTKITSFTISVLITGIVWAAWHYPAIIFADYNSQTPLLFQLGVITITVLGYSALTAWLRLKSGSIWPPVLWHGGHNLFVQQIFLSMTKDTGVTAYFVDDFGIGVLATSILLGVIFWIKRAELQGVCWRSMRCAG